MSVSSTSIMLPNAEWMKKLPCEEDLGKMEERIFQRVLPAPDKYFAYRISDAVSDEASGRNEFGVILRGGADSPGGSLYRSRIFCYNPQRDSFGWSAHRECSLKPPEDFPFATHGDMLASEGLFDAVRTDSQTVLKVDQAHRELQKEGRFFPEIQGRARARSFLKEGPPKAWFISHLAPWAYRLWHLESDEKRSLSETVISVLPDGSLFCANGGLQKVCANVREIIEHLGLCSGRSGSSPSSAENEDVEPVLNEPERVNRVLFERLSCVDSS